MLSASEHPSVIIDDREDTPELLRSLREDYWISCTKERLSLGDYYLPEANTLVERKREDDFAGSVISGRLFSQAAGLAGSSCLPFLILEEAEDPDWLMPLSPEARLGTLASLALDFGIPTLPSSGQRETALLLSILLTRTYQGSTASVRKGYRPARTRSLALYVLSSLPGLGKTSCLAALRHFQTLRAAFTASKKEWRKVPGIGKKTSDAISQLLDEPFPL